MTKRKPPGHDVANSRRQILEDRSYEIWVSKGCPSGTALQDWLEAEAELASRALIYENLWPKTDDLATIARDVRDGNSK